MSAVHLVADSTCDVSGAEASALGLTLVPLRVIIGEEVFRDGVDIDPAALYLRLRTSTAVPRTSQPTPADFEAVFRRLGADGAPIVCTTISAAMSGTHGSAVAARAALPDLDIRVIDTRSVGPGHRQVVAALSTAARRGAEAGDLERLAADIQSNQRIVFTVDSLEYLRRGGRIGGARALLGAMLNIKPILEVREGAVEPVDRVRTFGRALDRALEELRSAVAAWGGAAVLVGHADQRQAGSELARRAGALVGQPVELTEIGPVIGCHAGPGAVGMSFHRPLDPPAARTS